MNITEVTATVIASSGVVGTITAYLLGKRGQSNDERQQNAATRLQERISSFDELESINDRLSTENTRLREENSRLRDLEVEAITRGDLRLAAQARRCRTQIDETVAALVALKSVVVSEVARVASQNAIDRAEQHAVAEHPEAE